MKLLPTVLFAGLALSAPCRSAVVLTIDISNPASTIITAVANNSQSAGSLRVNFDGGISLIDFFTAVESITTGRLISGTWKAAGATANFNEVVTFIYGGPAVVPGDDLSIYNNVAPASDLETFVTSAAPFTGSSVVNLSGLTHLPSFGATGNVNMGYMSSQGGTVGQWRVIPEPATSLLGSAALLLVVSRRRRA